MLKNWIVAGTVAIVTLVSPLHASEKVNVFREVRNALTRGDAAAAISWAMGDLPLGAPRATAINWILALHRDGDFDEALVVPLRAVIEAEGQGESAVELQNLGYVLLLGIGGEPEVARAVELLRRSKSLEIAEDLVLVDPAIFDAANTFARDFARALGLPFAQISLR